MPSLSRRPTRFGRELLVAVGAFVLGTALVRAVVPPPPAAEFDEAFERFAAVRDEVELLVLGSSRVLRGFDAGEFEAELARAGRPRAVFGLGVRGLRTFEQDRLLRELLALEPARLRWILLEAGPVGLTLRGHHEYHLQPELASARHVRWHDPATTARVLASIRPLPLPPAERLALARTHLALCARNLANLARASGHLAARARELEPRAEPRARPLELADTPGYRAWLARIVAENELTVALDELNPTFHAAQVAFAAAHGVTLVHLTLPGAEGAPEALALHAEGLVPKLLHFADPLREPELFRPENRLDAGHLNPDGARLFSRRLAQAFLELEGARDE